MIETLWPDNSDLAAHIRTIPDYPQPGILFRDISTLLLDGKTFRTTIDRLAERVDQHGCDLVAGIEARGFIVAAALAYKLGLGKLMLRKKNKLPGACVGLDYDLEYGTDRIEMHVDACGKDARVLLVDDLLATGGTAMAAVNLIQSVGAKVVRAGFIVDLPDLGGAERLNQAGIPVESLISFSGH